MNLQPEFLPVGSIVEYNIGELATPEWSPTKLDAVDLQWLDGDADEFNRCHRPIPLTPEILTEWCGFEKVNSTWYRLGNLAINISFDLEWCQNWIGIRLEYLHQLQHLYSALTQTVLPIQIK